MGANKLMVLIAKISIVAKCEITKHQKVKYQQKLDIKYNLGCMILFLHI